MPDSETLRPLLQVGFYDRLKGIRDRFLHEALGRAIKQVNIPDLDRELSRFASRKPLNVLAQAGVRGEVFYPVPLLLRADPFLLGYYRLLFGFSQKEFYQGRHFGPYRGMEELGKISPGIVERIPELCGRCGKIADELVLGIDDHSISTVRELQILTLGPQMRGGRNTKLGRDATQEVYELLDRLLGRYIREKTKHSYLIVNDSRRKVSIEFKSDPDIRITERLPSSERLLVSIEIKGGADFSNIHNRLGEAEKSHQKARSLGSNECWTIHRVKISPKKAREASPTTTAFFNLNAIQIPDSDQGVEFREKLASVLSIRIPKGV
ncbi:MAG: XcyI family restriction endonuclease [Candidatus Hydrogenedentes bacterium]|nr:XcyI family restriction endonuclease [Candidatus Hydrogenedentota bacterium]